MSDLASIELLVLDVDGVLTDGRLHFGPDGESMKVFHVRDGMGIKALIDSGVRVAVISGRDSPIVTRRASELGISPVVQGSGDKAADIDRVLDETGIAGGACAVMGDDVPDLPMFAVAAFSAAPADAHDQVLEAADWVASRDGGWGAVRELCDLILDARGGGRATG